jgi:hypothetical protein
MKKSKKGVRKKKGKVRKRIKTLSVSNRIMRGRRMKDENTRN